MTNLLTVSTLPESLSTVEVTSNEHPMGGEQHLFKFPNGFGASVIRTPYSYGGNQGLYELAVLDQDGNLTYDTEVTYDVEGHLTPDDVIALLKQIDALEVM